MALYWDSDVTLVGDLPSKDLEVIHAATVDLLLYVIVYKLNSICMQ